MMSWRFGFLFLAVLFFAQSHAGAVDVELRYSAAAQAFHRLHGASRATPTQWRHVAANFESIHQMAPQHARGADGLYSAALAWLRAFRGGGGAADLADALRSFERFTTIYPGHRLADDSLVLQAGLLAEEFDDHERALVTYQRVLTEYPKGDQARLAKARALAVKTSREKGGSPLAAMHHAAKSASRNPVPEAPRPSIQAVAASFREEGSRRTGRGAPGPLPAATLKRLMHLSAGEWTRVILTLDDAVDFAPHQLARDKANPPRFYIDLKNTSPAESLSPDYPVRDAIIEKIRVRRNSSDTTRVVFDLKQLKHFKVREFRLPNEKKIVVDLYAGEKEDPRANATALKPQPVLEQPSLQSALGLKVGTLVIDPGHGGHDPGAIAFGIQEKDLALKIAQALRTLFQRKRPDIRVLLTRETDVFIPLSQRPVIAKEKGADLFISIHLNAHRKERFSGVETYFLNLTTDHSALRVAARENATSEKQVGNLNGILRDLLRDTNILESSKLAKSLQATLVKELRGEWPVRDLGVKQAPFMVLIGAEMPSVLVEAGFLTNRRESRLLRSESYLNRIAEGIYAGLGKYIQEQTIALEGPSQAAPRPAGDS